MPSILLLDPDHEVPAVGNKIAYLGMAILAIWHGGRVMDSA